MVMPACSRRRRSSAPSRRRRMVGLRRSVTGSPRGPLRGKLGASRSPGYLRSIAPVSEPPQGRDRGRRASFAAGVEPVADRPRRAEPASSAPPWGQRDQAPNSCVRVPVSAKGDVQLASSTTLMQSVRMARITQRFRLISWCDQRPGSAGWVGAPGQWCHRDLPRVDDPAAARPEAAAVGAVTPVSSRVMVGWRSTTSGYGPTSTTPSTGPRGTTPSPDPHLVLRSAPVGPRRRPYPPRSPVLPAPVTFCT